MRKELQECNDSQVGLYEQNQLSAGLYDIIQIMVCSMENKTQQRESVCVCVCVCSMQVHRISQERVIFLSTPSQRNVIIMTCVVI
jgi:hypothetical protein